MDGPRLTEGLGDGNVSHDHDEGQQQHVVSEAARYLHEAQGLVSESCAEGRQSELGEARLHFSYNIFYVIYH